MKKKNNFVRKAVLVSAIFSSFQGVAYVANADGPSQPAVVSFTMTPDTIDVATTNNQINFSLKVTNPTGIASNQTTVTLTNGTNTFLATTLVRSDIPVQASLSTVNFTGTLVLPSSIPAGIYSATALPITGLNSNGTAGYSTQSISATTTSNVMGASNYLLVRSGGYLNYNYATFAGPTFNNTQGVAFLNPKYNSVSAPIWKVGEAFDPSNYYELRVPTLPLKIAANTPSVCTSNGTTLMPIAVGSCSFTVYTDKTNDYQMYKDNEVVNITAARSKPSYFVGTVATQSSTVLPLTIPGPFVNGPMGLILPVTNTPTVCYAAGTFITVISGGTCTLNYSSPASSSYLASDIYSLTFEITRTIQTILFSTPTTAKLSDKILTLTASTSSGLPVHFQSDTSSICTTVGNSLNLLKAGNCSVEAIQSGSSTIAPATSTQTILVASAPAPSKKIVCVKAGKSKVFVGTNCPTGYKVKK